jgi:hypothetical protein
MKTKKADFSKEDSRNLEYLMDQFDELSKISKSVDKDDLHSVSHTNAKECVLLKAILSYMVKCDIIDSGLVQSLNYMIELIEGLIDDLDRVANLQLKERDKLSIWIKPAIYTEAMIVITYRTLLLSFLEIKVGKIKALRKQGEKLRGLIEKQKKESEEKISTYVA